MKQRGVYVLGAVMAVVLAFSGCRKQQAHQVDQPQRAKLVQGAKLISVLSPQHADSLVLMAYKQGDYQRMLTLTDSLSARGELNELRTSGYRATAYRGMKDMKAAIASLRRAIEVEDVSDNDYFLMVHLKTLYAELQQLQGNSEGALRTALALIEQLRSDGYEDSEFCQRLYSVLGESQLNLDHPDEAAKYFERMYGILQKSIRNDSVGDHLMEGVEALGNVTSTYLANEQWDQAELWVDRLDSVFTLCRGTRYAADYPVYVDWYLASVKLSRALIAEVHGQQAKALQYYKEFQTTDFSKSDEGRMTGSSYLLLSHRYDEAAENYVVADRVMDDYGFESNLQMIGNVLMPKLRANYYAGRKDSALRVAMQIADLYDTAYVKQKRDATAEMATIYDVEGKERLIAEREAKISQQRFIGVTIALVILIISFLIYAWLRHRMAEMRAKQERIDSELRIAREIQMSMVPSKFPKREGLDMYAMMTPAKEVGGDLYGYILQRDKLYFCVGDVSGKGVPASLFMAQVTRLFRTLAAQKMMPDEICTRMNDALSGEDNERCMFVTFFIGLLDIPTGHLIYCNAGHNYPVINVGDDQCAFLKMETNMPIGPMPGMPYVGGEIDSIKGKPLLIYTDGLNEAENNERKLLGNERMLDILRKSKAGNARELIESLAAEVEQHREGAEPSDDLTMMAIYLK
jgi:serine phosphatase RsbU (regulator of sigma subunit)